MAAGNLCSSSWCNLRARQRKQWRKRRLVKESFDKHALFVFQTFDQFMPNGTMVTFLSRQSIHKREQLTGKQIWDTCWRQLNTYVVNQMIPEWMKLFGRNNFIPSGHNFYNALTIDELIPEGLSTLTHWHIASEQFIEYCQTIKRRSKFIWRRLFV